MNIFKIDKQSIIRKDEFCICYRCLNNNDLQIRVLKKQNINRGQIDKLLVVQNIYLSKIYAILEENEETITIVEDYYEYSLHEEMKIRKKQNNWFTEGEIGQIMTQIVKAYKYLYDNQIIHGNISSMSVFLSENQVKLGQISLHNLDSHHIICSPAFSAPEIFQTQIYSSLSEVFSLGVLYYKLVNKTLPFKGNQIELPNIYQELQEKPFKCPPNVSTQVAQTIESMLTYSTKNRMQWQEVFSNPLFNVKQPSILIVKSNNRSKLEDSIFLYQGKFLKFNEQIFIEKGIDHSKLSRFQHILNIYLAKAQYISYVQVLLLSQENSLSYAKQAVANYCISGMQLILLKQCEGICTAQIDYLSQEFLQFDVNNLLASLKEFAWQLSKEIKLEIFHLYMNAYKIFNQSQSKLINIMPDESDFKLIHKINPQFEDFVKYLQQSKQKLVNPNYDKLVKMYEKMLQLNSQYPLRLYSSIDPKNIISIPN